MKLSPNDIEAAIAAACVVCAVAMPRQGKRLFQWIMNVLRPLDRRRGLAFSLFILLPVALRLALIPWDPAPQPRTMEEHNHILQAETYAAGRLANATHPLAVLFNEFQIVEWPRRVSARPPACALFFWLGDVFFDSPWAGNVASVAIASGLIYWMLLGWTRPRWATLGAFLVIIRYCVFGYWINSFWGPTVPLIGGVLVLGIAPRIRPRAKLWHAVVFALGVAMLAGSRPFEGVFFLLPVCAYLFLCLMRPRQSSDLGHNLKVFIAPLAAAGVLIVGAQMAYDKDTTGKALVMPYQVWRQAQTTVPAFIWQPLSPSNHLTFYYPQARLFQEWEEMVSSRHDPPPTKIAQFSTRHVMTLRQVVGPMLLLPFLCWGATWFRRRPGTRELVALCIAAVMVEFGFSVAEHRVWASFVLIPVAVAAGIALAMRWRSIELSLPVAVIFVGAIATSISSFYMPNYLPPFVCAFLVVMIAGIRNLSLWDRKRGTGASLAGFLIAGSVAMFAVYSAAQLAHIPLYDRSDLGRYDFIPFTGFRDARKYLTQLGGKHLVFVRYGNNYLSTNEYVWNGPDIDSQNIVWARDLHPEWTAAAVQYYKGRRVWLLDRPDERGPEFQPYPLNSLPAPEPIGRLPVPYRQIASR